MEQTHFSTIRLEVSAFATRLEAQRPGSLVSVSEALIALRELFRKDDISRNELMQASRHVARLGIRSLILHPRDLPECIAAGALYEAVKGLSGWLIEQGKVKPVVRTRELSYQIPVPKKPTRDPNPVIRVLELRGLGRQEIRESDIYPLLDWARMGQPDPVLQEAQRELAGYYTVAEEQERSGNAHFSAGIKKSGWGWVYHRDRPEFPVARVRLFGGE